MHGVPLRYSLRNLLRRPSRTVLTVLGLSLLVALIVFLTAFGRSFGRALRMPGDPRHLIVISKRAQSFEFSSVAPSQLDAMAAELAEELETGPGGRPLLSREIFAFVDITLDADPAKEVRRGLFNGVRAELAPILTTGFELIDGRMPRPDGAELLVGRNAADRLRATPEMLAPGAKLTCQGKTFTVAGVFRAPGTLYENWILADPTELSLAMSRSDYSFARLRLKEGVEPGPLASRISLDERYEVKAFGEPEYFADFAEGFAHFQNFAVLLAVLLGVAGVLTGMNTFHNAVVGRIREIGTLRVLGFTRRNVLLAFLLEAMTLAGFAGLVGCGIGILSDGLPMRVPVAASFPVVVDGFALAVGFGAALSMGLLGLLVPMYRALSLPAVEAVRAT